MRLSEHRKIRSLGLGLTVTAALLFSTNTLAQSSDQPSLGNLARKQREKQQQTKNAPVKPKKVVTDEDLPAHAASDSADETLPHDGPHAEMSIQRSANDVLQNGDQMKTAITRQKALIADLKNRIDKLNSSIQFVQANAYRNGVEYNKYQAQKQQEVDRLQGQLNEQQRDLEQMQETARKAGYGSAVWDP
jgi:predicted RNase H-like nuclease (RuvC/YqgF family)